MRIRFVIALLLIPPLALTACGDSGAAPTLPSLTGTWRTLGTEPVAGIVVTFSMQLTERGSSVTGTGTIRLAGGGVADEYPFDVIAGTRNHPALTLTVAGDDTTAFRGRFENDNEIRGSFDDSPDVLTFLRQ